MPLQHSFLHVIRVLPFLLYGVCLYCAIHWAPCRFSISPTLAELCGRWCTSRVSRRCPPLRQACRHLLSGEGVGCSLLGHLTCAHNVLTKENVCKEQKSVEEQGRAKKLFECEMTSVLTFICPRCRLWMICWTLPPRVSSWAKRLM